eukprot:6176051-Pleurochrysis_carterae.AAC.1
MSHLRDCRLPSHDGLCSRPSCLNSAASVDLGRWLFPTEIMWVYRHPSCTYAHVHARARADICTRTRTGTHAHAHAHAHVHVQAHARDTSTHAGSFCADKKLVHQPSHSVAERAQAFLCSRTSCVTLSLMRQAHSRLRTRALTHSRAHAPTFSQSPVACQTSRAADAMEPDFSVQDLIEGCFEVVHANGFVSGCMLRPTILRRNGGIDAVVPVWEDDTPCAVNGPGAAVNAAVKAVSNEIPTGSSEIGSDVHACTATSEAISQVISATGISAAVNAPHPRATTTIHAAMAQMYAQVPLRFCTVWECSTRNGCASRQTWRMMKLEVRLRILARDFNPITRFLTPRCLAGG